MENWKDIEGFPGYQVSNQGQIRSHKFGKVRIMNPGRHRCGCNILLSLDGKKTTFSVHQLVASHFIGPRPDGYAITHLDGNNLNNQVYNLRYVSLKELARKGYQNGKLKQHNEQKVRPVIQTTIQGEFIACFPSTREAARETKLNHSGIIFCLQGRQKTAGGFKWQYV